MNTKKNRELRRFNFTLIVLLVIYLSLSVLTTTGFVLVGKNIQYLNTQVSYLVYGKRYSEWTNSTTEQIVELQGIYIPDKYYCVWTEGYEGKISERDPNLNHIEETAIHEYCHSLVNEHYDHFCNHNIEIFK